MMTDVKRMRAQDAFLEMPLAQRNCEVELYEECRTRKLPGECNCVPWELPGYPVSTTKKQKFKIYILDPPGHEEMRPRRQGLHCEELG